jgi:hypothetical protein
MRRGKASYRVLLSALVGDLLGRLGDSAEVLGSEIGARGAAEQVAAVPARLLDMVGGAFAT